MTAVVRFGWNVTFIRMGSYARTVGTPNGVCSVPPGHFPAYRCRACEGSDTLLTGTVCAKTRQRPATLVPLLRGIAKGEPTARRARE